jgi:hypothetical protein
VLRELDLRKDVDGFITFDANMLKLPTEIVALVLSTLTFIVCDGVDNDSLQATGLLMVYMPRIIDRLSQGSRKGQVVVLKPSDLRPRPADQFLNDIANHRNEAVNDMVLAQRRVSDADR